MTKNRHAQNLVRNLISRNGSLLNSDESIKEEVVGFYKGFLGTGTHQLPAMLPHVMNKRPNLSLAQQVELIKPFTKKEVL